MRSLGLACLLIASIAFLPTTHAATPTCASVTQPTDTPTGVYLVPEPQVTGRHVWIETNLVDGLQKVACVDSTGATVESDRDGGVVGIRQGGQPVCFPRVGCIFI